ncbi:MAG: cyclodeaminase/cyclohydrolase family protein [Chloroflexi bacterium]|nr:cyclodeaminase/cyclohydrolase family protein [Chloroflexota bacterium]
MDRQLRDLSLHDLLEAYSAPAVAPAGASAAALTGALGASLVVKVARITHRRLAPGPDRDHALAVADKVGRFRQMLEDIVDQDVEAYARVVRLKAKPNRHSNQQDIERALKTATLVPGAMGRAAVICVNSAAELVEIAHLPALSDLGMGARLCLTAAEISLMTVQHNLSQIADESFRQKILGRLDFFDNRSATLDTILAAIGRRTGVP